MARLIDADALDAVIENHYIHLKINRYDYDLLGHYIDVEMAPTVDAAPVVHGRWIKVEDFVWKCSICGEEDCYAYTWGEVKKQDDLFCPRCGARMDGDGE